MDGNVSRETSTAEEIRKGLRDTWAVGLGLIPLGLAFGVLIVQSGYAWWWAPIFSLVIYAGSAEFLAISLVSSAISPLSAAVTGFLVNFRHVFYGLTYPRNLIRSRLGRAYSTYSLTDESYAIVSTKPQEELTGVRVATVQWVCQLFWVLPGIVGALAGQLIPPGLEGLEFALTALFVVLAWDAFKAARDWSLVLIAGVFAIVAGLVAPAQMLVIALAAYVGVLGLRFALPGVDRALRISPRGGRSPKVVDEK